MGRQRVALVLLLATAARALDVTYSSVAGQLLMNGEPLALKGLNWYGYETGGGLFHGLYAQPASVFLDFFSDNDFNAIRIPVDLDLVLNDRTHGYVVPEPWESNSTEKNCTSTGQAAQFDPVLQGYYCPSHLMNMTSMETLDWFIDQFAARGVLVLLDMHCLDTSGTDASPVFYNDDWSRNDTLTGWQTLAERYRDRWNVFAADIFNEPFGATWAEGLDTDMDAFCVDAAAVIHGAGGADWLIFVEGAFPDPNCTSMIDGDKVGCGYGDNLLGVADNPVVLTDGSEDKLVYSVHTYGPSQHDRNEFSNADFPTNMPDVWDYHWGYITEDPAAPAVVLGEWGGPTNGTNGEWEQELVSYLTEKGSQSNFFWSLNQDGSPQGVFLNWTVSPPVLDADKLDLLASLVPEPTDILALAGLSR